MKSSTRTILVIPLIGLAMYMAWAGMLHGKLLARGDTWPIWWQGHSATLGGLGWLSLAGCFACALVYTNQSVKSGWLIVVARICLALFFLLEGVSEVIAWS
jgi:hypothetical protein